MWERLAGWFQLLWDAGQKTAEHSAAIDELQEASRRQLQLIQVLATQNELLRKDLEHERQTRAKDYEMRAKELENLELRLRLQISEELRRSTLPPPPVDEPPPRKV